MKKTILTLTSALGLTFMAHGQATTDTVGYNTVTCPVNSDTIVSVPFLNTTDSISTTVSGSPSGTGSSATFTLANVSGLTTDQYATLYYVRFTSGQLEGEIYQITGNTANTVTIDTLDISGATRTMIEDGNSFTIYKFWTLGTLFPPASQTTLVAASSSFNPLGNSSIKLPNYAGIGTDLAPSETYYIYQSEWKKFGDNSNEYSDKILWPDSYFIIRNSANVPSNTTYRPSGTVDAHSQFVIPLSTRTDGSQDNYIAVPRPVDVTIANLGLVTSGEDKNFEPRTSTFDSTYDRILVFDNSVVSQDKAPSKVYFYDSADSRWELFGVNADAGSDIISPSSGLVIRKTSDASGKTYFWANTPSY